jgi:hypothetical protein
MNTRWKTSSFFGWSYSKQKTFNDCKKQFYYKVIAKYEPGELGPLAKCLGNLTKIPFLKGHIIHRAIAKFITDYKQGNIHTLEVVKEAALDDLDLSLSEGPRLLVEYYNGLVVSENRISYLKKDISNYLNAFFTEIWPSYSKKKIVYIENEEDFPCFNCGGCKVYVKPDLVTADDNHLSLVTDWKAGDEKWGDDPEESVQLTCYVYWASQTFGIDPASVTAEFIYLAGPSRQTTTRNMAKLENFTKYVHTV